MHVLARNLCGAALRPFTTMKHDVAILAALPGAAFAAVTAAPARQGARREEAIR